MSSYVTTEPDGSREVDVQSLFYDQIEMVRRIAKMNVKEALGVAERWREERVISVGNNVLPHAVVALADEVGKLHAAQQRITALEGERDRLRQYCALAESYVGAARVMLKAGSPGAAFAELDRFCDATDKLENSDAN